MTFLSSSFLAYRLIEKTENENIFMTSYNRFTDIKKGDNDESFMKYDCHPSRQSSLFRQKCCSCAIKVRESSS